MTVNCRWTVLPIDGGENGETDFFGISSWVQDDVIREGLQSGVS